MSGAVSYAAEMRLPSGVSCEDCAHARRCFVFGFAEPGQRSCDFHPSRFAPPLTAVAQGRRAEG